MKIKVKTKDCKLVVKAKTSRGEVLDEKELDRFARAFFRGFLKPRLVKKNIIEYTGPIGISLFERLKSPITKRDFLFILEQIVVAVQKLQSNKFSVNSVVMDLKKVYINEVTREIQFLFFPIGKQASDNNLIEFIETIAYSSIPNDKDDNDFVSRFIYHFKAIKPFDVSKIESFVASEDKSVVSTIKRQNAGQSGFMTNNQQHYYEHYGKNDSDEQTALLHDEEDEATGLLSEGNDEATGLLCDDEDCEATGLLKEESNVRYPYLIRVLTQENISINKPVFRLGKEKSYVDYFVTNNVAVSRSHADIIKRGDRYYIKDLNSKNHTYINNQEISVNLEMEIHDGDKIKLANEEFIFNL